jgi:hypothetical protein
MIVKETLKENLMSEIHSLTLLNASGDLTGDPDAGSKQETHESLMAG